MGVELPPLLVGTGPLYSGAGWGGQGGTLGLGWRHRAVEEMRLAEVAVCTLMCPSRAQKSGRSFFSFL